MNKLVDNQYTSPSQGNAWLDAARRHGLLSRLPDSVVATVVKGAQRVEYPPGTIGLRWDEAPKAAIVLGGTIRSFITYPDGAQVTIRYLRAGDLTGVFAPRRPALARGVQAMDRSELLFIDGERMKELALAEPRFAWALIEELTSVLNANQRALYIRAFGSVRQRVISAIVDRALASDSLADGRKVLGTQQELAVAVGSVREVVASTLGALKHERLIDVHRGVIVIVDAQRLAMEAEVLAGSTAG